MLLVFFNKVNKKSTLVVLSLAVSQQTYIHVFMCHVVTAQQHCCNCPNLTRVLFFWFYSLVELEYLYKSCAIVQPIRLVGSGPLPALDITGYIYPETPRNKNVGTHCIHTLIYIDKYFSHGLNIKTTGITGPNNSLK